MTVKNRPAGSVKPYEQLSFFYDELMAHVNYKEWTHYLKKIFKLYGENVHYILDISCGTASHLSALVTSKRKIYGADLSLNMLRAARKKSAKKTIHLINANYQAVPFASGIFDAVFALYDSVNYLLEDQSVLQFLSETRRILRNNGFLIFDVVTPYTCKNYFDNYHEKHFNKQNEGYERKGWFDKKYSMQYNEFRIQHQGQEYYELHQQKIRSLGQWVKLVKQVWFSEFQAFEDFTFSPAKATSERAHFILRKQ